MLLSTAVLTGIMYGILMKKIFIQNFMKENETSFLVLVKCLLFESKPQILLH